MVLSLFCPLLVELFLPPGALLRAALLRAALAALVPVASLARPPRSSITISFAFVCPDVTSGQVDPIMNKLFNINFSAVQLSLACLAQCCEKNQLKVVQKLIPILQAGEVLEKVARKRGQNFANAFVRRLLATNFAQQHWPVLSPMFAATIEKHLHDQVTFSSTKPFVKLL